MKTKRWSIIYTIAGILAISDAILVAFGVFPYSRRGTVMLGLTVGALFIALGIEKFPECDKHGWQLVRFPEEIFNRCAFCGHRMTTDGLVPKSTRRIMLRRPLYAFTELYRRHWAKKGQIHV